MNCRIFTSKQRKELHEEAKLKVREELIKQDEKHAMDYDSIVLWALHKEFNFGEQRLRRFWTAFRKNYLEMREHYLTENIEDDGFICRKSLKDIGVDIEQWYKEIEDEQVK